MQGSSRGALATAEAKLAELVAPPVTKTGAPSKGAAAVKAVASRCETLASDLFAVVDLLDAHGPLRRALTDPARAAAAKSELLANLLGGSISPESRSLVAEAAGARWSRPRDLSDALEVLAIGAVVAGAEVTGAVDQLEAELFRFERIVAADAPLAAALSDRSATPARRRQLVQDLLAGKATAPAVVLLTRAVVAPRGQGLGPTLQAYLALAAQRRSKVLAVAKVAVALDSAHRERLVAALSAIYGKDVQLQIEVDPAILGGIRVEIGDEILDGSIANKLAELDRRLAH